MLFWCKLSINDSIVIHVNLREDLLESDLTFSECGSLAKISLSDGAQFFLSLLQRPL